MAYVPHSACLQTPIGRVVISGDSRALHHIRILAADEEAAGADDVPTDSPVADAARQISDYFAGKRTSFDLPLVPLKSLRGEALRQAIASVGYGKTMSYGTLAQIASSGARAVGGACARNPYPIVIPCHRITSSGGAAEKYSAGDGPSTKAWLIAHEARHSTGVDQ
jgi:methylated-DNA-[protein]-cysteine S-methyltransferase